MKLKLYNTETRELEILKPLEERLVRMYTCGPTIYDFAHIGNFRTYVFEDLLRRTIRFFGFSVEQVMNITDIDDKTIRGALRKELPLKQYTEPFRIAFFEDLATLNIEKVEHYPNATDYIPEMIELIRSLLNKGFAYESRRGGIYFSIRKFKGYGRLSHFTMSDLKANASGENDADEYDKENISDFALWKAYDPQRDGSIYWESPFGKGRPGWHIECSAMAMKLLGSSIDIHCGGVDNCFPHHENEIAQSEGVTGKQFVRIWLHSEHLLVDNRKMSKSLGNFYTLRDLLQEGFSGMEIRYLLLATHYRTQLNFTFAGLNGARASLQRIHDFVHRLQLIQEEGLSGSVASLLEQSEMRFKEALGDDLNIAIALSVLFDLIREGHTLADEHRLKKRDAQEILQLLQTWDFVLGLQLLQQEESAPAHVQHLLAKREEARKSKNWSLSDLLRKEIATLGYGIEDTPSGARLKKR